MTANRARKSPKMLTNCASHSVRKDFCRRISFRVRACPGVAMHQDNMVFFFNPERSEGSRSQRERVRNREDQVSHCFRRRFAQTYADKSPRLSANLREKTRNKEKIAVIARIAILEKASEASQTE